MKAKHHHLTAAACLAVALCVGIALAACTDDARTPGNASGTTTPLILNATVAAPTASPASRANTAASQWTAGDEVTVEVNNVVKKYLVHLDNGVATLRPADADNTHFWPDLNQSVSVRAWRYGHGRDWNRAPESWSIESTQDGTAPNGESLYQHSDFLYAPAKSVSYSPGAGAGLTFYHQTARIVVRIREAGVVNAGKKEMISVRIGINKGNVELLKEGTFAPGRIDPDAGQYSGLTADPMSAKIHVVPKPIPEPGTGYARCYEALVIPQDMSNRTLIEVSLDNKDYYYTPTDANLLGGNTYTYDITVSEHGTLHVTAGTPITEWDDQGDAGSGMAYDEMIDLNKQTTINDNRTYLLTGTNLNAPSNLVYIRGGSPTIILKDADIEGYLPIIIEDGTPTIRVEGKNQINSKGNPAIYLYGETANVHIIGDGRDKNRLTAKTMGGGFNGSPAIGNNDLCGDISLSGITLVAEGSASAAIGIGGEFQNGRRKCGSITITDCHVEATAWLGSAAIGFGYSKGNENTLHEIGDITITNSTLKCTVHPKNNVWPAHIGGSANGKGQYTVGKITITPPEGTHGTEFFRDFTKFDGSAMLDNEIIVGFPEGAKPTNGAEFDVYWKNQLQGPVIRWGDRGGLQ